MENNIEKILNELLFPIDIVTVIKGVEYYERGSVEYCEVNKKGNTILISSLVAGSYLYSQEILVDMNELFIDGSCSCPVGYNCKHVVAAIFEAFSQSIVEYKQKENYERWLEKLEEEEKKEDKKEYFLTYRFSIQKWGIDIGFYKSKMLKKGGISKGVQISEYNLFMGYQYKYDFLSEKDKEIISFLKKLRSEYSDDIKFEGEFGAVLLKKIIATKRAFYEDSREPLYFSKEKKKLKFLWQKSVEGTRLVPDLSANEIIFHKSEPILCINKIENRFYEIECNIPKNKLIYLLDAPIIPENKFNEVLHRLISVLPQNSIDLPDNFDLKEVKEKLVPYLYIYGQKEKNQIVHYMQLKYLYGEYEFDFHSKDEYLLINNKTVKILRDFNKEAECKEYIENLGFEYSKQKEAFVSFVKPNMQEAIERWRVFIDEEVEKLRKNGWKIEIDDSFEYRFEYAKEILADVYEDSINNWFTLSFKINIGKAKVELLPIVVPLLKEFESIDDLPNKLNLKLPDGKYLHITSKEIKPILQTIYELFDSKSDNKIIIKPYDAHLLDFNKNIQFKGAKELEELSNALKNFKGIKAIEPSENLKATLRDYQKEGVNWLNFLHEFKFGGILADDMGLGKTIQTLAYLQYLKENNKLQKPTLIIVPTSLIGNWKSEIEKFTPNLTSLELYGIKREEKFQEIDYFDIILTTYNLIVRDFKFFQSKKFEYIILDEAQKIKNPATKIAKSIKELKSNYRLALTGTPIENHLGELWSIFDFLMSGFLGNLNYFKEVFQNPIEKEKDLKKQELLNKKVAPFILRRTKEEVIKELPPKTEIIKKVKFTSKQAILYENIRVAMEKKVKDAIKDKGLNKSHIMILDALLKLRQVCCHPKLLKLKSAQNVKESAKLEVFLELIDTLMAEKRKILVFSQFTSMLSILEEEIKIKKIKYTKLTGATRKRQEAIEKFTKGDAQIFLISLKAGGVGLNLIEADTVIHYDPWWNPAVENQATDRVYRIGQKKAVFVYKLVIENSIEEKILKLQKEKQSIQEGIYTKEKQKIDGKELIKLLSL